MREIHSATKDRDRSRAIAQRGSRDADCAAKRSALLLQLRERLGRSGSAHPSFRELADTAGVGEATLRHYFGGLTAEITAVLEDVARDGARFLNQLAEPTGGFASYSDAVKFVAQGQRQDAIRLMHAIRNAEGARRRPVGRAYRAHLLDTSLEAVARRRSTPRPASTWPA